MNYSQLKQEIQDYCQNNESTFVSNIDNFIRAAEDKIFSALELPAFWKSDSTISLSADTPEYTLKAGTIDVLSVRISAGLYSLNTSSSSTYPYPIATLPGPGLLIYKNGISGSPVNLLATDSVYLSGLTGTVASLDTDDLNGEWWDVGSVTDDYFTIAGPTVSSVQTTGGGDNGKFRRKNAAGVVDELGPVSYLLRKDYDFLLEAYPGSSGAMTTGTPLYYSISSSGVDATSTSDPNMTIRVGPIPDTSLPLVVTYYGKTTSDSITGGTTTTTTWLSTTFPDVLLNGSLVHAYLFMKSDPEVVQIYERQYSEGILLLKNIADTRQQSGDYRRSPATDLNLPPQ